MIKPAFPTFNHPEMTPAQNGMNLREYFAIHSDGPDGECTASWIVDCLGIKGPSLTASREELFLWWRMAEAKWKVAAADALIKELGEKS